MQCCSVFLSLPRMLTMQPVKTTSYFSLQILLFSQAYTMLIFVIFKLLGLNFRTDLRSLAHAEIGEIFFSVSQTQFI